jgi:hypothetical protein|tara:strand:+ start:2392 stop:2637 length:246 start_codon:yes stop_codon:yes gene_type:complete
MDFKQKKDGSCTLNFNDKEIDIIKTKKQIHFTPEALRHFGNVLMKIVIDFNQNFTDEVKDLCTEGSIKIDKKKVIDDKDNK